MRNLLTLNIHILDLDGTMMPSHEVDNSCYWQAVGSVFNVPVHVHDLGEFEEVTDPAILAQWARETLGREPSENEVKAVKSRFLQLLHQSALDQPGNFVPTPGLEDWLRAQPPENTAIATGGWRHTAEFKIYQGALGKFRIPLATSDDATQRINIMRHALSLLLPADRRGEISVTYIGDGPWDFKAAHALGWSFIGVARGDRAIALEYAGAEVVRQDFHGVLKLRPEHP